MKLDTGTKLIRARTYKTNSQEIDVSKLSYIPDNLNDFVILGRLNQVKQPVYYGCIYFTDKGGVNLALSESSAEESDTVNVLRSKVATEVNVYFVGIFDYIHRDSKPRFMSKNTFSGFKEVYEYQESEYSESIFLAHILCDAFLSDILRRKRSGNLYEVTSRLFSIYASSDKIDGVIYTSAKSEGAPVMVLKTEAVDSKLLHQSCDVYRIEDDYGYAKYKAINTHQGFISNWTITWFEVNTSQGLQTKKHSRLSSLCSRF